jgi:hypothetical protein
MMPGPRLTDAAIAHLHGRPLVLRASPRLGCCGGHALVPVAEIGPPLEVDAYRTTTVAGVTCFVDARLGDELTGWTVDAVGFARWRRLLIEGAEGLDPAHTDHDPVQDDHSDPGPHPRRN